MQTAKTLQQLDLQAEKIRVSIIKMLEHAGSGHSAGSLGMADILTALYFAVLRHDPKDPLWPERDIFILSNGHCNPALYATMAHADYFPKKELMTLRQLGSRLQGHPERLKLSGLETTSGPLGSGLSQAAGMALSLRMQKNTHRFVYCTTGDGELNEGNIWEAAMFASKYQLGNLITIIDRNNIQIDGPSEQVMPLESIVAKWESFGWHVQEVDGHNIEAIIDACAMARAIVDRPSLIIAHTIPGKGVDFMEYDYTWHGKPPGHKEAKIALEELRTLKGKIIYE
jgi:transketolase